MGGLRKLRLSCANAKRTRHRAQRFENRIEPAWKALHCVCTESIGQSATIPVQGKGTLGGGTFQLYRGCSSAGA